MSDSPRLWIAGRGKVRPNVTYDALNTILSNSVDVALGVV